MGSELALSAANGNTVHFIIRPNQQVFETPAGVAGKFDRATLAQGPVTLEAAQGRIFLLFTE